MDHDLLTARPACFQRSARCVEPDICAGNKMSRDVHVVILDEHYFTGKLRMAGNLDNTLHESFALLISGMGLAGKNKLDRVVWMVHKFYDAVKVPKDQWRTFVCGKSSGKTECEDIGRKRLIEHSGGFCVTIRELSAKPLADEVNEVSSKVCSQRPQFLIRGEVPVFEPTPILGIHQLCCPVDTESLVPEFVRFRRRPAGSVDAIRDKPDGHFINASFRI